jgi:rod shape-determining protein MreC
MNSIYRPFIISLVIGILLVIGGRFNLTRPLQDRLGYIVEPVLAAENASVAKSVTIFSVLTSIRDLARENAALRGQVVELQAEIANLKEVRHENDVLRGELQFSKQSQDTYVTAQIVGRTATGIIKDLVINQGTNDGVAVNQAVVAQGYLVGMINSVTDTQATVMLVSHPHALIPVSLQDSRSTGMLRGGISGLTMSDILIDAAASKGETVVTSGLGGLLPPGVPIGRIAEIESRAGDITKKATVTSPLDATKLEIVFVRKAQ